MNKSFLSKTFTTPQHCQLPCIAQGGDCSKTSGLLCVKALWKCASACIHKAELYRDAYLPQDKGGNLEKRILNSHPFSNRTVRAYHNEQQLKGELHHRCQGALVVRVRHCNAYCRIPLSFVRLLWTNLKTLYKPDSSISPLFFVKTEGIWRTRTLQTHKM